MTKTIKINGKLYKLRKCFKVTSRNFYGKSITEAADKYAHALRKRGYLCRCIDTVEGYCVFVRKGRSRKK